MTRELIPWLIFALAIGYAAYVGDLWASGYWRRAKRVKLPRTKFKKMRIRILEERQN